jgi:dimethylhistidine N-methyltransferase
MMHARTIEFPRGRPSIEDDVLRGLTATPKTISSKFLYDERGSELFEMITALPEYYLSRCEFEILRKYVFAIGAAVGGGRELIELGSGSSAKVRLLLDVLRPSAYVPVDISRTHLEQSVQALRDEYPSLHIVPVCADYSEPLDLPESVLHGARVAFFPGSTIGNFEPTDAIGFMLRVAHLVGHGGQLLIGVDLKKDADVIERAYNDVQGVTAAFNLNILLHLNARFGTDFAVEAFDHRAHYDADLGRIEMHLVSRGDQTVHAFGRSIRLHSGETIHTENSYKYDPDEFDALARAAGFAARERWFDSKRRFMLALYQRRVAPR